MNDSRFFTMSQLWQSLAISVVIGGIVVLLIMLGTGHIGPSTQGAQMAHPVSPGQPLLPAAAALATSTNADPFSGLRISGQAAIVVDLSNGQTIYSQNADSQLPLASLTKLLTIYEAQNLLSPNSLVTISSTSLAQDGDYGFTEGETFAYKDISRLALVASSNDAAEAIAEAAEAQGGESAAQFMAASVQAAGLSHTTATNGTGLDIDTTEAGAYGSARDIAKLSSEFIGQAPDVAKATTRSSVTIYSTSGIPHTLSNTNPDVSSTPGILLSKTGYTDLAGGNLAIVFDAGINHRIAVVVLGSTRDARFTDVEKLIRATLASFRQRAQ